jgi:hypothetical protein
MALTPRAGRIELDRLDRAGRLSSNPHLKPSGSGGINNCHRAVHIRSCGPTKVRCPWDTFEVSFGNLMATRPAIELGGLKGIGGVLSSVGDFRGRLDRIEVEGTTSVPDFSLDSANHPMQLFTRYHAIVDGTNGDTYLEPPGNEAGPNRVHLQRCGYQCEGERAHHRSACRCACGTPRAELMRNRRLSKWIASALSRNLPAAEVGVTSEE